MKTVYVVIRLDRNGGPDVPVLVCKSEYKAQQEALRRTEVINQEEYEDYVYVTHEIEYVDE